MKRKKLSMFIVIIFFIIFVITIGILVVNNKKRNSEFEIQEYIPQEEISYEQLRKTNIFLYYLNKKTGELDSEIRQIDSRELLEKPEKRLIELLIEGPQNQDLKKIIPEGTRIIDINLEKGILNINFSEEFILNQEENMEIIVESINKTILELNEINSIKILINGEEKLN